MSDFSQNDDELLSAYLDDELAPEERARVEERLAADPAARQLLEELRSVSRTMKELPAATLGTDLRESVLRRAERAMLVSGELASASGKEKVTPAFPIGRSKRAWFWAGAALAAGLMLMIFDRDSAQDADLPLQVAKSEGDAKLVRNEPLPRLEFRAVGPPVEQLADREAAAVAVADNKLPVDSVEQLAKESSPASLGLEMTRSAQTTTAPAAGARGGADDVAFRQLDESIRAKDIDEGKDLLVVHVNMKPEAMRGRAFDNLLLKNQIEIEEEIEEPSQSPETQDVEVVVVEAMPQQVVKCLDEIKNDETNYLGMAVDDRLADSQRSLAENRPEADMKQYNRGVVPDQQVALTPDNNYYYKSNIGSYGSETTVRDAVSSGKQSVAEQPLIETRNRYFATDGAVAAPVSTPNAPAAPSGPSNVLSSDAGNLSAAGVAEQDAYLGSKVNVARRAVQQLEAKADTLQVLFVLTCPSHPAAPLEAAAATATPASDLPDSPAPAQEGPKGD